jgi:hypothetical protein
MISLFQELSYNCQLNLENKEEKGDELLALKHNACPKKLPTFSKIFYILYILFTLPL